MKLSEIDRIWVNYKSFILSGKLERQTSDFLEAAGIENVETAKCIIKLSCDKLDLTASQDTLDRLGPLLTKNEQGELGVAALDRGVRHIIAEDINGGRVIVAQFFLLNPGFNPSWSGKAENLRWTMGEIGKDPQSIAKDFLNHNLGLSEDEVYIWNKIASLNERDPIDENDIMGKDTPTPIPLPVRCAKIILLISLLNSQHRALPNRGPSPCNPDLEFEPRSWLLIGLELRSTINKTNPLP
jgi:hypothetical protein